MPKPFLLVYVDRSVEDKPQVVVCGVEEDHILRMNDPLQVKVLIDELHKVLTYNTKDNRWVIE